MRGVSASPRDGQASCGDLGMRSKKRRRLLAGCVDRSVHHYYIAGPLAMIESTEVALVDAGIDHTDIRIDSFDGY